MMKVEDVFTQNRRLWIRLREKGGKRHEMPCHHNLVWETTDYIDVDPINGEGMIPINVKMTIDGDRVHYDLSGSHSTTISTFLNCCYGGAFAAIVAGTKMQSPDIPLNSGFYRVVTVESGPRGRWSTPIGLLRWLDFARAPLRRS